MSAAATEWIATTPKTIVHHVPRVLDPLVWNRHILPTVEEPPQKRKKNESWLCPASKKSQQAVNPIQSAIQSVTGKIKMGCQRADGKVPISLANADTTVGVNLPPCAPAVEAVVKASSTKPHVAGYANATGTTTARVAIAKHHSYPEIRIGPQNVIVTNGCSGALELALTSVLDAGSTVLIPRPGFPLYEVIAKTHGAKVVHYDLNPDKNWECNLEQLENIATSHEDIRAMVINNPSSPTGAVFTENHLVEIADFAARNRIPVVSDEVYGDLTFGSNKFYPMAQIVARCGRQVPVITASGLSKQYLLPGWRVGWLAFHDNVYGSLQEVQTGANCLAQIGHGISQISQAVIPTLLNPSTPGMAEWKKSLRLTLKGQAATLSQNLARCHGLQVIPPQGTTNAIIKIDINTLDVKDDLDFATKLVEEENVFVLPGQAMGVPNVIRVVSSASLPVLEAATRRVESFCLRHAKNSD